MKTVSQFRKLNSGAKLVDIRFEGVELSLQEGANLAAELLFVGVTPFRYTPVSGAPRNPFCMMGACFDCLVDIDGITQQACMVEVEDGMTISMPSVGERRNG